MRTRKIDKGNFFLDFEQMVARKDEGDAKRILESLIPEIRTRYDEYWRRRREPEQVQPNEGSLTRTVEETDALEGAYGSRAKIVKDWDAKFSNGKMQRCPYCQIETATHWDHFLPHSLYPDYSVYQANLVRTCDGCNALKNKNKVYPNRGVVHPYFDPLDRVKFLHCDVGCTPTITVTFSIKTDDTQRRHTPYLDGIVREHFRFFGLEDLFTGEAASAIGDLADTLRTRTEVDNLVPSKNYIDSHSRRQIDAALKEGKTENCWEIALWRAVLRKSADLVTFWTDEFRCEGLIL